MGKLHSPLNKMETAHGATGLCHVCGEKAVAFWSGNHFLEICHGCAVNVLPALIADAVLPSREPDTLHAERALPGIEKTYWKAVASAIGAAARQERKALVPGGEADGQEG